MKRMKKIISFIILLSFLLIGCAERFENIDTQLGDNQIEINDFDCNIVWEKEAGVLEGDAFSKPSKEFEEAPWGLDENGICYYDYGSNYGGLGKYSNPTYVAAYANALYCDYLDGDTTKKEAFLAQVDYLMESATVEGEYAYWTYSFEIPSFECPTGWYSAMTSGRILGVLARCHSLTGDNSYLDFAEKVFNKLCQSREEGGMTTYSNEKEAWLEADTYVGAASFKVLNGHIYGLSGLYDYALYTENEEARELVQKCFNALLHNIDAYDSGYLSYYCEYMPSKLKAFAAPHDYHTIHINQLLWCYKVTNESSFLEKAMRFQMYDCFNPQITASHTVDEIGHGTDKMNLSFGNNYWSSSEFPVVLMIDCQDVISVSEIILLGHSTETSPTDIKIKASTNNTDWFEVKGIEETDGQYPTFSLNDNVELRYCKIEIGGCSGGDVIALDGVGFTQSTEKCYPVFYSPQMFNRGGTINYNLLMSNATDRDDSTGIRINNKSELDLIIPNLNGCVEISVEEIGDNLKCYASDDLTNWKKESFECVEDLIVIKSSYKYLKVEFNNKNSFEINKIEW
ncbi:MAG: D-glucuronyl C5-epimerase family protein [Lachnospiraceae bacterium]